MTKKEALQILSCQHIDEARGAFEMLLFDFKSKFLQQIPPLKLIDASIKKIERITIAFDYLVALKYHFNPIDVNINWSDSLDITLTAYQTELTKIRLRISNSLNGEELILLLNSLKKLQSDLFLKLDLYGSDLKQYPIKLSDQINVFDLQTELKDMGIQDTKISEYIRAQIENNTFDKFSKLTKAVLNAKKQIEFNGLRR